MRRTSCSSSPDLYGRRSLSTSCSSLPTPHYLLSTNYSPLPTLHYSRQVSLHKCQDILRKLHVGQGTEPGLASAVSRALQRIAFVQGDFVIRAGEDAEAMYFVLQGEVEVLSAPKRNPDGTADESTVERITKLGPGEALMCSSNPLTAWQSYRL